jgi:group I intron endonuclease
VTTGIYVIANRASGNFYIGSSYRIESRIAQHFSDLRNGRHTNQHLQSAFNLYGETEFWWSTIEICNQGDLLTIEQKYLDGLCPKYNILPLAGSSAGSKQLRPSHWKGKKNPIVAEANRRRITKDETRKKHSERMKIFKITPEQREKARRKLIGHVVSESTREKLRRANTGRKLSDEARSKLSKSLTGRVFSQIHRYRLGESNRRRARKNADLGRQNNLLF